MLRTLLRGTALPRGVIVVVITLFGACEPMVEGPSRYTYPSEPEPEPEPPTPPESDWIIGKWITEPWPDSPWFRSLTFHEDGSFENEQESSGGFRVHHGTWEYQTTNVIRTLVGKYGSLVMYTVTERTEDRFCTIAWVENYDPTARQRCHTRDG